jgi:hypothetical protein
MATQIVKEFTIKGFAMDDEMLNQKASRNYLRELVASQTN